MLQPATLKYLGALKKNNDREWFEKNREKYDVARADFDSFIAELIKSIGRKNKQVAGLLPKECVYRIYRDVRFSKNKAPYKTNFAASITEGGRKSGKAGFYIHIEPGGKSDSILGGGVWMPEATVLKAIRQEVQYNTDEFKKIISNNDFIKCFGKLEDEKLKTVPKGFDKNDPDIELYKYTSYLISLQLKDSEVISSALLKKATFAYKTMLPFLNFLNRAVS